MFKTTVEIKSLNIVKIKSTVAEKRLVMSEIDEIEREREIEKERMRKTNELKGRQKKEE